MTVAQVILPLSGRRATQESVTRETRHQHHRGRVAADPDRCRDREEHRVARRCGRRIVGVAVGFTLAQAPKIAKQWERAVVLRLGRYVGLRGPGLFWIMPFVDTVTRGSISA